MLENKSFNQQCAEEHKFSLSIIRDAESYNLRMAEIYRDQWITRASKQFLKETNFIQKRLMERIENEKENYRRNMKK